MTILRHVTILCGFAFFSTGVYGQFTWKKKPQEQTEERPAVLKAPAIERKVSELIADRVDVTKKKIVTGELEPITFTTQEELLEAENLLFPADELYQSSWDTCWVNPFRTRDITMPDSFRIDCSTFVIPVDNELVVTSKYGPRRRRMHRGIDLKVHVGDTIRSAFSGKVRIKSFERRGYGNYLVIRHPNGLETIYGHLSRFLVSENEIVKAGQPIALGGNTGRSTGPHLHFETRFLGEAIDPSHIIDFDNGTPHQDFYVFYKNAHRSRNNLYTSTSEHIVYHRVKKGESLGLIARKHGLSVAELCRLNGLKKKSVLRVGQTLRCGKTSAKVSKKATRLEPAQQTVAAETVVAKEEKAVYHCVQRGETLYSIARQHGTTVDALCKLNNIRSTSSLHEGQEICYRAAKSAKGAVKNEPIAVQKDANMAKHDALEDNLPEGDQMIADNAGQKENNDVTEEKQTVAGATTTAEKPAQARAAAVKKTTTARKTPVYHRVRKGDTLGAIARRHRVSVEQLCKLNNIQKTTVLKIGRSLRCS
ncbi:LysM peptidoglycan-binding domain-containing protein [Tannerella sp.]|uniref:LysM peptidoglycan-binding domain-containing protein n=1 Tax=Tannerella sp. TaxID=2382127 RepID=UPI0026DD2CC3|nr:LysM peptidoglycan-binding domain-containing protein [Tannerella sp.]MDO4703969.1 LysM peptidoglycan-binding domain-containing protein [Tannerella sp.]